MSIAMDANVESAELSHYSGQHAMEPKLSDPGCVHDEDYDLPPITTETLASELQTEIAGQTWDRVSVRQPLGFCKSEPGREKFIDFASAILEMRLADVVKHRREARLSSSASRRSSHSSEERAWFAAITGEDNELHSSLEEDTLGPLLDEGKAAAMLELQHTVPAVLLTPACRSQLRAYVRRIASMYRQNRYHGLEHAVHVTMSANKLLDMLHEGPHTEEGSDGSDDDGAGGGNDFSVSESYIMGSLRNQNFSSNENGSCIAGKRTEAPDGGRGCVCPRPPLASSSLALSPDALPRKKKFSEDFHDGSGHFKPSKWHRNPDRPHRRSSTYLIYSDVFTKFAFVFAAIIHDVDHQGVPNTRLVLESDPMVEIHGGISTAEKHSIKVAFRTLAEAAFEKFREVVFESPDEELKMHRIVRNLVLSTDIASPERMQSTKMRWEEAFSRPFPPSSLPRGSRLALAGKSPPQLEIATVQASKPQLVHMDSTQSVMGGGPGTGHGRHPAARHSGRRSSISKRGSITLTNGLGRVTLSPTPPQAAQTAEYFEGHSDDHDYDEHDNRTALRHSVVIETMLNVADVAHSMQSWELFLFWNRRLFEELHIAFSEGRSDVDPSKDWYENQLGFYRIYVIPLAEKMEKCGVFGDRGGEWVKNAKLIRNRWGREGAQVTEEMIASVQARGFRRENDHVITPFK